MPFIKGRKKTGGRKKNSKNTKTIKRELQRRLYENFLLREILKEKGNIVEALIAEAKKGNVGATREINERLLGKVKEQIEHSGKVEVPVVSIVITPISNEK